MVDMNNNNQPSSLPPSEATSQSHSSRSITNPDRVRVFVRLTNGTKYYVPVAQTATIRDLHEKVLQRAVKFGFRANQEDTFFQTTGASGVALCGEDSLCEVLDLTGSSIFDLCLLENHSLQPTTTLATQVQRSREFNLPRPDEAVVFVRWVILEAAISHSRLSAIQTDRSVVSGDTTLAQFYYIAVARFSESSLTTRRHAQKVILFLRECCLFAKNSSMSLHDLKLSGSKEAPLDVFVDLDMSEVGNNIVSLTDNTNLKSLWGFETTKRGVCTLTTSLKMLIEEIEAGSCVLDRILGVLFELTHFPPLLIAFTTLYETGLEQTRCSSTCGCSLLLYTFCACRSRLHRYVLHQKWLLSLHVKP